MGGCRGRALHEELVDWARFDLPVILRGNGAEPFYMLPEVAIRAAEYNGGTGKSRDLGVRYPDVTYMFPDGPVLLEVGCCEKHRWPDHAVVRVAFTGKVQLRNPHRCASSRLVYQLVCRYLPGRDVRGEGGNVLSPNR
jgi:hypothetical protein